MVARATDSATHSIVVPAIPLTSILSPWLERFGLWDRLGAVTFASVIGFGEVHFPEGVRTVSKGQSVVTYPLVKWTLFTLLMLVAPSLLFLVMAIMFVPAIFFAAGIVYMIPKALVPSQTMETLTFIGFFGVHLLVYAGVYYLLSVIGAKLLFLVRNPTTRNTAFAVVCLGVMSMALLPVYGGGGHGPIRWNTLLDVFHELNRDYGPYTVLVVYGSYIVCVAALLGYRKHRRGKIKSAQH